MSRFRRPPPTPAGFAAGGIALAVLVRSLYARNAYEIVLALAVLLVWGVLYGAGRRGAKKLSAAEPLWNIPLPVTAGPRTETALAGGGFSAPWFFRLHFTVSGRFYPQGAGLAAGGEPERFFAGCRFRAETALPRTAAAAPLPLGFPLGGVLRAEVRCLLRDIFGFFAFPCGVPRRRALAVRSAPCPEKKFRLNAQSGAEDRRNKTSSDEERYYMREYAPGDRFRDINWKSSGRLDALITRIAPDNQEKVSRIEVRFRNYGPDGAGPGELWLLDRAKARLAWFLRSVKDENAAYVFAVRSAGAFWELADQEEVEAFLDGLAGLPFAPPGNDGPAADNGGGELYVFSTACDAGLPAFLAARQGQPVTLFLAQPPRTADSPETGEVETLRLRDFPAAGMLPPPRWFRPGGARPGGADSRFGPCHRDYAGVRL